MSEPASWLTDHRAATALGPDLGQPLEVAVIEEPRRRTPWFWFLAVAAVLGGLLATYAWAVASPPGASPDEDFHLNSIWCPTPLGRACNTRLDEATGWTAVEVLDTTAASAICFAYDATISGACTLELTNSPHWTTRVDDGGYPGAFYDVMHLLVGESVAHSVTVMRVFNGLLAVALFGALAWLLPPSGRRLLLFALLPGSVPLAVWLLASINPTGWVILGVPVAWFGMYGALRGHHQRRRVLAGMVIALIGAFLAAGARADGGAFLGVAAASIIVLFYRRFRRDPLALALPLAVIGIGLVGFLIADQSSGLEAGFGEIDPNRTFRGILVPNLMQLPRLLVGFALGSLNWLDTPTPPITWAPVLLVTFGVFFVGLRRMSGEKLLALLGVAGVYVLLPLAVLQLSLNLVGENIQERYVLPLLPVVLAVALWDPQTRGARALSSAQSWLAFLALSLAHAVILHVQIRRFTSGLDFGGINLNAGVEWWLAPISPMLTWFLGSVGFAGVAALFLAVRRRSSPIPQLATQPGFESVA